MRIKTYRIILWLLALAPLHIASPATLAADAFSSSIKVDFSKSMAVNRRLLGVDMIASPFDAQFRDLWSDSLRGTSARIWASPDRSGKLEPKALASSFQSLDLACSLGIDERNGFAAGVVKIGRRARYRSATDNNLDPVHQPIAVAKLVETLEREGACGITGWEVWNEPQFPLKGAWPAKDLAAYAIDVAAEIHKRSPSIRIGVPLHERDMLWNSTLLSELKRRAADQIDFLVFHPYWLAWTKAPDESSRTLSRTMGAVALRADSIIPKMETIRRFGDPRWRVVASEWNIHPKGLRPPFDVSTDMAAALHLIAMVDVFASSGVASAQFFDLLGRKDGHFHLSYRDGAGYRLNPTGLAFQLIGRYMHGEKLDVSVVSPSAPFDNDGKKSEGSVLVSQAFYDSSSHRLVIFAGNRHRERTAQVELDLLGAPTGPWRVQELVLSAQAEDPRRASVATKGERDPVNVGTPGSTLRISVPPETLSVQVMQLAR